MAAKAISLLFLLWMTNLSVALTQERYKADSLLQVLDRAEGRTRVEILRHLSRAYIGADKEKSIFYAKQSVESAEKLGNDTFIVRSLNNMAVACQNSGDFRGSLPYLDRSIGICRKNGNRPQLLESLGFKATCLAGMRKTDKALPFAQESLQMATELKDSVGMLNALEIIAASNKDLHQLPEAIQVYEQELALLRHLPKRIFEKGRVSVNMGEAYAQKGETDKAIALFKEGKKAFDQFGYPVGALLANLDLADAYLDEKQYDAAGDTYRQILEGNKAIQEPELNAISYTGLGVIAMEKGRYEEARNHFFQAEKIAKAAQLNLVLKKIYGQLNDLYCLKGDYDSAQSYKTLSNAYADSVLSAEVRDRISELKIEYETSEKEKEIAEQELQINAQQSEIFRKNTLNYGLFASFLAALGFGYLFYNRFRLRKKAELDAAVIREQQLGLNAVIEAQENERKRIARDLHDGIAQELVALKLGFDALGRRVGRIVPEESPRFEELNQQLDASCTELRGIAHVMSPPVLEKQGLAPSLDMLLRQTMLHSGVDARLDAHDLPASIHEKARIGLYRITQELLNNIVKHAQASSVLVELYSVGAELILRVEDDGVGFNFEEARAKGTMGLLNIISRTLALNGSFATENRQPHGAIALVKIPL